jgi:predicted nucleic acid-binding protein
VPLADAILATIAIENKLELWTRDTHFQTIQTVFPELKLFTNGDPAG